MEFKPEPMHDLDAQPPAHLRVPGRHSRKINKKIWIIIGVLLGVLLLGGAGFFLLINKKDGQKNNQQSPQNSQQNAEPEEPATPADPTPQTFKSDTLNIEFTHRKDWTVTESADKKQLTITSPKTTYQTADGESRKDVFTLRIGLGASDASQATFNKSKAVKDSLVIAYDAPTEAQRHYTNVSFAGDQAFRFFVVTGSNVYKPGDPLAHTVSDGDFLIAGGYGTDKDDLAFDAIDPLDIEQAPYEQALAIVKSLKVY